MVFHLSVLGLLSISQAYVLLQVSKDEQNRSNVDALIHKVVPPGKFEEFAAKLSRKRGSVRRDGKELLKFKSDGRVDEVSQDGVSGIEHNFKDFIERKPVFRHKNIEIKPEVIKFRSNQPALMYHVNSDTIIMAIKEFLTSSIVEKYTDEVAKQAAYVYRSMKDQ